jgi:glycosyltransferase involved in cell wall biosynthesis
MKISVIIPAYNSEQTIRRALDSVLNQTRPPEEIIVVDDGSMDKTAEAVRAYGEKVRLIRQENAGVSVARNTGITAAAGDWIAFLDADDEWLPEKLQRQTYHLARHPELRWTYGNFYLAKPNREPLTPAHVSSKVTERLNDQTFDDYLLAYTAGSYAWTSVLIINRDVFAKTGLFEPGMRRAQDNDLWFRIAYQYPAVGYLPEPLAIYHLDTPHSSTKINDDVGFMIRLVERHETLSRQHGRDEAFRPCLTHMLKVWIRTLLQQDRYSDTAALLDEFPCYLSSRFRREIRFRLMCPPLTNALAEMVIALKRKSRESCACQNH